MVPVRVMEPLSAPSDALTETLELVPALLAPPILPKLISLPVIKSAPSA